MKQSTMVAIGIVVLVIIGAGAWAINNNKSDNNTTPPATQPMNMNDKTNSSSTNSSTNQSTAAATDTVKIENFEFNPATITVKKGTKVTWTNKDSTAHTVTADDGSFDSKTLDKDATFSFTFNAVGTVKYHCTFHSNMTASVVVTE